MEGPQKAKNRTTIDPAIPLLGIYPKECESAHNTYICTSIFITALQELNYRISLGSPQRIRMQKMFYIYTIE
jgi:hypothetical protein